MFSKTAVTREWYSRYQINLDSNWTAIIRIWKIGFCFGDYGMMVASLHWEVKSPPFHVSLYILSRISSVCCGICFKILSWISPGPTALWCWENPVVLSLKILVYQSHHLKWRHSIWSRFEEYLVLTISATLDYWNKDIIPFQLTYWGENILWRQNFLNTWFAELGRMHCSSLILHLRIYYN